MIKAEVDIGHSWKRREGPGRGHSTAWYVRFFSKAFVLALCPTWDSDPEPNSFANNWSAGYLVEGRFGHQRSHRMQTRRQRQNTEDAHPPGLGSSAGTYIALHFSFRLIGRTLNHKPPLSS
ncbi:hypothetical protein BDV93DRAFT_252223 [Ceratobasidium sp. AG-I]|nr:hypothetical protein BDV93DRAFT_252223 [Ceratobasidium sp. AG-I]